MGDKTPGFSRIVDEPFPKGWNQDAFEAQLGLVLERVDEVAQAALTPKQVADAVRDGITAALADPATWAAAMGGMRASTEEHAGRWMVGAVWSVIRKMALFTLAGLVVYSVGGWSALSALWKTIWGSQP
jgi:hypothetical protein